MALSSRLSCGHVCDNSSELNPSELGTKTYWEEAYQDELSNFTNHGDVGEVWFGSKNEHRVTTWMLQHAEKASHILDIGCGNGHLLIHLAAISWMVPSVHLHPNGDLPAAPLQLPPASANRTPVPVGTNYPIWQPGIVAPGGGTDGAGFISQTGAVHFGHDIAPSMPSLRWLLLQAAISWMVPSVHLHPNCDLPAVLFSCRLLRQTARQFRWEQTTPSGNLESRHQVVAQTARDS
ncbi:uncharacterized protein LOC119185105 isoform X5 [Rhipicephalus microplus]|uniref:uncharacterized protein LOC119185105 isoform X5 n=1 Tax=Rhipicephalus microplus TaxID=6941 RepID=UPI003F6D938E